ncbi:hypothetical protein [Nocardia asiatica]|uniref:hypothetical protein n=1 Tax=Nocardia asiatica TaxID=209252 RepID=UPI0024563E61|nr:hypothetical protein [Nocardia asiatica]
MTSPGGIRIPITADGSNFGTSLRDAVLDGMRTVQTELDTKPLDIKIDLDMAGVISTAQTELAGADLKAHVEVDLDIAGAISAAETTLAGANLTANAKVDLDLNVSADQLASLAAIQTLADKTVTTKVDLDLNVSADQLAAIAGVQALADKTVNVKFDLDMTDAELERLKSLGPTMRSIRTLTDKDIKVKIDVELSQADLDRLKEVAPALRSIRTLGDKNIKVKIDVELSQADLDRLKEATPALRSIRNLSDKNVRIKINLDMSQADLDRLQAIAPALRTIGRLTDKNITVRIDIQADEARLRAIAALLRDIQSRNVRVNVDTDADGAVAKFTRLSGSFSAIAGGGAGVAAALAAIGGAAGAAAGAVGGLVLGMAALGPAAAAIAGTAAVGLSGIKDAFKAAADASDAAGDEGAARAKAVAAAQEQVESALDGVTSARRTLTDAEEAAADATKAVTDALADASSELDSYDAKLKRSALSEDEARRALEKAQKAVATAKTPDDRIDALLRLRDAELDYEEAQKANVDLQDEANKAREAGVEGNKKVIAARKQEADANQAVTDANTALVKAQEQVVKAQAAVAEAQSQGSPKADDYAKAMAKLAPAAQEFVLAGRGLMPLLTDLKKGVQQTGFEELGASLTDVGGRVIPVVKEGMTGVAGEMNIAAKSFLDFIGSARGMEGIRSVFQGTVNLLEGMRAGAGGFTQGILDFVAAAEPAMFGFGQAIAQIGGSIGQVFSSAAESGQLAQLFSGFTTTLQGAAPLLAGLVSSLITLGSAVLPELGPLLASIGGVLTTIAPSLGALGAEFARSLTSIMPQLGTFIAALAEGLRPVLPVIAQLLGAALTALTPLIGPLSDIAQTVGTALVGAIQALAPSLGPMATAFSALVTAVAPLVPLIAENLSVVLQALAPALTEVATALAPVISDFATQMQPVIAQLAPVLAETARIVGVALADAIRQLAPSIPDLVRSFSDLLLALAPLLPEFARMAAELLPPLVDILVQITPQVIKLIDALTWLVQNVIIPYVIPAIRDWVDQLRLGLQTVADVIEWWRDKVTGAFTWITDTAFPALGRAWDTVQGWFDTGVERIAQKFDQLREAAAVPVRFVVNTVFNDGLRKAWNAVNQFLPGAPEIPPVTLGFATGGAVWGPGTGTSDSIPAWLSTGEHIITAAEVIRAGGQNVWYAIRDMIARGIPFTWDGGRLVQDLGRQNLDAYGAAVKSAGIGNVDPQGLFDPLLPRFRDGGAVMPWMYQLKAGHDFARAQDGRPYQWAGPRWVGDSFDCSGFMSSIAAVIMGMNQWVRYWFTGNFSGQQVGPQGFVHNLTDGVGMVIGVSNGGPGGGHTAGELRGIPELGIAPARVESGGALGDVHYGRGTPVGSFQMLYGLPIGANGFFQPSTGGSVGPSPADQSGFVQQQINRIFKEITDPIRAEIESRIGPPPPLWNRVPEEFLTAAQNKSVEFLAGLVGDLGGALPGVWSKAQELAGRAFDLLTPFDSGGIASGIGFMPKNVLEPERVLDPQQTRLFEALVAALQRIAGMGSGVATVSTVAEQQQAAQVEATQKAIAEQGETLAETRDLIERSESSQEAVTAAQTAQLQAALDDIAQRLGFDVLQPIIQSGMDAAVGVIQGWLKGIGTQITAGTDRTTAAVQALPSNLDTPQQAVPFGAPGSAFDAVSAISDAVVSVANTAAQTFQRVAQDIANAALQQKPSRVAESRGVLGKDIPGGQLVDLIVQLTGVEIEVRDTLLNTLEEIQRMRGDLIGSFDTQGRIVADTAELMQRNESSRDLVISEQNRLNRELIKAVLKYLMTAVVIPIMTAILGAMITLASTAIGAAIGSFIPIIGTAIGAAVGAMVGAALGGVAAVFTGALAVGAAAAIDSFDSGGVAVGRGLLSKDIVEPERVLSPRQTVLFDRMVTALETQPRGGNRTVHAPITYVGAGGPRAVQAHLLELLNN